MHYILFLYFKRVEKGTRTGGREILSKLLLCAPILVSSHTSIDLIVLREIVLNAGDFL